MKLEDLKQFIHGSNRMTRQQFRNVLRKSIGASKDYADGCLNSFRDNPAGYVITRNPDVQGRYLIERCMELGDSVNYHFSLQSTSNPQRKAAKI
jgi:hypothetical protein